MRFFRTAPLLFLLFIICLSLSPARADTQIMVVSDTHYLAPALYQGSDLFLRALRAGDGKITQYGEELMDALAAQALAIRPDALILTGDLSFNGEKASHEALAARLQTILDAGIPVYVLPGNHDINCKTARQYSGETWAYTDFVTPEEFSAIYAPFMLPPEGGAGLSYHVELNGQVWLTMMDAAFYQPEAQTFGTYTLAHDQWLRGVLKKAEEAGAEVISCTHHSLIAHTEYAKESFVLFGSESMRQALLSHGARLNLSGHLHIQHIARDGGLADAATGAFSVYPHRYGLVTRRDDGTLSYEARALSDEYLPSGFQAMSRDWFSSITMEKNRAMLSALNLPEAEVNAMLSYSARFNTAYFSGEYDSHDPAWKRDEAYALWQQHGGLFFSYMDMVMNEETGDNLRLSFPGRDAP